MEFSVRRGFSVLSYYNILSLLSSEAHRLFVGDNSSFTPQQYNQ